MKIAAFMASLLPSFTKDTVLEDLRLTHAEYKEFTIPAYATALPLMKSWKFKSEILDDQFSRFARMVKGSGNPVVVIHNNFKNIMENIEIVEKAIEKSYNEEVAGAGMTYSKSTLLQLAEAFAFVSKYARKWLIYIYIQETKELPDAEDLSESLTPAEKEWIEANFISFCTAFGVVSGEGNQMKKRIEDIPDIVVTSENVETMTATLGENKIDPFQLKLIPIWMNPIYHIGMFVAEWQADRYKAAKEELRLLQLRKLNLERLGEGKPDARLQKEISYTETRIQALNYKIAKMEKDAK